MKKVNLVLGLILFAVFVGTGIYMRSIYIPENLDNDLLRMQIRSNHIYILMVSLLNILSFGIPQNERLRFKWSHNLWRSILLISGVLSVFAFCFEHQKDIDFRLLTTLSLNAALGAVIIFFLETIFLEKRSQV